MALFKGTKLLIIGIDGVPYELIQDMANNSFMPNLKQILNSGKLVKMMASLPEISSVSWSGFMTGTDSGEHGVFGFIDLERGNYQYRFPDFRNLKSPTFFDDLGKKRKKSIIINLPFTYPARKIPGVLISGFVALDLDKSIYPPHYNSILKEYGYQIDVDSSKGKDNKEALLEDLFNTLKKRKKIADYLWKKERWDLFMFTITGTDRLHHFLFDAYVNKNHSLHNDFINYYKEVDNIIGDFFSRIEDNKRFHTIILSDHGFGLIEKEIYLNPILKKNGFFETEKEKVHSLDDIKASSKAFALDPSRIYVHLKGKYSKGSVSENDYHKVREELKQLFENYEITGKRIFNKIYYKEELYSKRYLDQAPDIILLSNPGFDLKAGLKKKEEYGNSHFTGMHLQNNAFFFATNEDSIPENMTIFDAKQIIYKSLNI